MARDRCTFCFGQFFAFLLAPPDNPKNQNFKKMKKKPLEISSFNTSVPKIMIKCFTVPEICCATDGWLDRHTDGWMDGWKK